MSIKILSGFQPSGRLHLGNYFGGIKPLIIHKNNNNIVLPFIADLHALTSCHDPIVLQANIKNMILDLFALGLDSLFIQSQISEITQLFWILSSILPVPFLERSHAYKDKLSKGITSNLSLLSYPALMAADILILAPDIISVGVDQSQHLELLEEIIKKFRENYNFEFIAPVRQYCSVIVPGIDGQKMSKSYNNYIPIFCEENELKKLISKIVTNSAGLHDRKEPNTCTIFSLYKLFADEKEITELKNQYTEGSIGYGHAKTLLFEKIWNYFSFFRNKRKNLENHYGDLLGIVKCNGHDVGYKASKRFALIKNQIGLV